MPAIQMSFTGLNNGSPALVTVNLTHDTYDEDTHRRLEKSISQAMHFCGLSEYELDLSEATLTVTKIKGDGLKFSLTTDEGDTITFANPFAAVFRYL